jgi:hypothetical protein
MTRDDSSVPKAVGSRGEIFLPGCRYFIVVKRIKRRNGSQPNRKFEIDQ